MVQGFVAAVVADVAAVAVFCDCCSPGGSIHVFVCPPPQSLPNCLVPRSGLTGKGLEFF